MQFSKEWLETGTEPPYILEEIQPPPLIRPARIDWAGEGFTVRNDESST
jgi:hypothetical protein